MRLMLVGDSVVRTAAGNEVNRTRLLWILPSQASRSALCATLNDESVRPLSARNK